MARQIMQELPQGARFIGPDRRTEYLVLVPADAPDGAVQVRNLSMTAAEAAERLATPGAVEDGADPREGSFLYSFPVEVEVLS